MKSLDEMIDKSTDVREVKRALSVKMVEKGLTPASVSALLNVSVQYVSKWKATYQAVGVDGLLLAYQGGSSYLMENSIKNDRIEGWAIVLDKIGLKRRFNEKGFEIID